MIWYIVYVCVCYNIYVSYIIFYISYIFFIINICNIVHMLDTSIDATMLYLDRTQILD